MKDSVIFTVAIEDDQLPWFYPHLGAKAFAEAHRLAQEANLVEPEYDDQFVVNRDILHEGLPQLFALLRREGWTPVPNNIPLSQANNYRFKFNPTVVREYDTFDLDSCPLLRIAGVVSKGGEAGIRQWTEMDGKSVARVKYFTWEPVGNFGAWPNPIVTIRVRKQLEAAGLIGLGFRPLLFDKPDEAKEAYWEFVPAKTMPPTLVPVFHYDPPHGFLNYRDGPIRPVELRYRSADVAALGEFDIAATYEAMEKPPHARPGQIVSQRFRQVCNQLKIPFDYTPVRLDAPPPPLPWFFTSDAPPSGISPP